MDLGEGLFPVPASLEFPVSISTVTASENLRYFQSGVSWAGPDYTVIPGSLDKVPLVGFKDFSHPAKLRPTREDRVKFRAKSFDQALSPLLLLDSPAGDAFDLCVIDIDDLSAAREVLLWLISKGLTRTMVVETGREGGGKHFYFLREASRAQDFRSGKARLFGKIKGEAHKYRVDLKAACSYAVCPGALHKSGKVYRAEIGGSPVESLEDVLHLLPVMKLEDWLELHGASDSGESSTEVVSDGSPEWGQILADGRERQPCPWCKRGGDRVLAVKGRTARCFFEGVVRRVEDQPNGTFGGRLREPTTLEVGSPNLSQPFGSASLDSLFAGMEGDLTSSFWDEDPAKVLARGEWDAKLLSLAPPILSDDRLLAGLGIPEFPPDDPLAGSEKAAGVATHLASGGSMDFTLWTRCPRAPNVLSTWHSKSTGKGGAREFAPSCWSYSCPGCGDLLVHALASAIRAWTFTKLEADEKPWKAGWVTVHEITPAMGMLLQKHTKAHSGDFHWVGVASSPGEIQLLVFWREASAPKPGSALWEIFEDSAPWVGSMDEILRRALGMIDLPAWQEARSTLRVSRIVLLRGPSEMQKGVAALQNYLTGHKRAGKPIAEIKKWGTPDEAVPEDSTHKAVPTRDTSAFWKLAERTLLTTLDRERADNLPLNTVAILEGLEASGEIVPCHAGHRKGGVKVDLDDL